MLRRTAADGRRLALLVLACAALTAHHASAHSGGRLTSAGGRSARSSTRLLRGVEDSTPADSVVQIYSRKCGVANTTNAQSQRVIDAIADNIALRESVRQSRQRTMPRVVVLSAVLRMKLMSQSTESCV